MKKVILLLTPLCAFSQPPDFVLPELRTYLRLTEAQVQEIQKNNAAYRQSQNASIQRVNDVNREIGGDSQSSAPDPGALGVRYQEIELLCRQRETPLAEVYQQNMRVMTEEQRGLLRRLESSARQSTLAFAADAVFLLSITPFRGPANFPTVFNGTPYRGISLPGLPAPFGVEVSPDLVAYLQLAPAQLEQLRANVRAYQDFYSSRLGRMNEVNRELQLQFAQDSPQPLALGDSYWEIEALRRQIADREADLRRQNLALLTPEQNRRLQELPLGTDLSLLSQSAQRLNLLAPSQTRPASRASGLVITVVFPSGSSSSSLGGNFTATTSIYRTCQAGPEFEYRVEQATPNLTTISRLD